MLVRTLLLTTALQLLLLVAVSIPAWRKADTDRFVQRVATAVGLLLTALVLFAQRGALSGALTVVLANALLNGAHQIWLGALYRICGIPRTTRRAEAVGATLAVAVVAVLWAADTSPGQLVYAKPRVVAGTAPIVISGMIWIRSLHRGTPSPRPLGKRYLGWAAVVGVGLNLTRVSAYLMSDATEDPVRVGGSVAAIVLLNLMGVFTAVGLILEIEARARAGLVQDNHRLASDALTDPLTGFGNRRRLEQQTEALVAAARAHDWPVSVLVLDIDHFKQINDRHGHAAGDAVLCAVARHCAASLREQDILVRWGGEEFAAVLPRCTPDTAAAVAGRILTAIRGASMLPGDERRVTASIGISQLAPGETTFTGAIRRADAAMYQAKAAGRDGYAVHG